VTGTDIRRCLAVVVVALATVLSGPAAAADDKTLDKYYNANTLCRAGIYPLAAKEYEAFLAANPKHEKAPRAKWGLAVCRYSMGQMDKAAALLAGLAGNEQIADQEQLHNLWGSALVELGKPAEAVAAFEWTVKNAKRDDRKADALAGLTQAHFALKSWPKAVDASNALIKHAPTSRYAETVRYQGAVARMNLGKLAEAVAALQALIAEGKSAELVHQSVYQAAECLVKLGKPAEAAEMFKTAATKKTGTFSEVATFNHALLQFRTGKYNDAITTFRNFVKKHPDTHLADEANLFIGRSYLEMKKYREAAGIFDGILRGLKDSKGRPHKRGKPALGTPLVISDSTAGAQATLWLVRTYARQGKNADVAKMLKPVVGAYKDDSAGAEIYYELARAQMDTERFDEAAGSFAASEKGKAPLPEESLRLRAFCLLRARRPEQSLPLCDAFLTKFPDSANKAEVLFLKGENLSAMKRLDDAAVAFAAARKAGLDGAKTRQSTVRTAQTYYRQKQWAQCLAALKPLLDEDGPADIAPLFEKARKGGRKPPHKKPSGKSDALTAQAWFMAGDCRFRLEQWDGAREALGTFLIRHAEQPNADVARYNLSLACRKLDKTDDAIAVLHPFIEARPETASGKKLRVDALIERGRMQYDTGKYRDAQSTLQHVRDNPEAIYYLGWAATKLGDDKAAADYFARLGGKRDQPFAIDASLQRSVLLYRGRKYAEAEAALSTLLKFLQRGGRPEQRTEVTFYLGLCRAHQKNYAGAIESFRQITQHRTGAGKRGPEAIYWQGWCEKQRGNAKQAETLYATFVTKYATDALLPAATFELAELRFHRLQEADRLTKGKPKPKGKVEKTDYAGIADSLRPLLDKDSKTLAKGELRDRVVYLLGWCLFKQEQWGPAAQTFESLIAAEEAAARADRKRTPSKLLASAYFQAAESRRRMKEFGPAKDLFAKAAKLRGTAAKEDQDDMLLRLSQLQAINNQWKQSLQSAQSLLQSFPDSKLKYEALFAIGWAHENQRKYRDAMSHYRKVVAANVRNEVSARAQFQLAECYFAQGQRDDAIVAFNLVVTKYGFDRWNSVALLGMGRCFQAQGKAVQARAYFDDVILKYPNTAAAEVAADLLKKSQ